MERIWIYLINPVLTATLGSNALGIRISNTHDAKLFAGISDPFIAGLYATYHVVHIVYTKAYNWHKSRESVQQGLTSDFMALLKKLGFEKINLWDSSIATVYPKGSAKYKSLLANGHAPFQNGSQQERISAATSLSLSIGADPSLAAVKTDIDTFVTELEDADTAQKGAFMEVEKASNDLETARVAMAEEQYGNLGAMIKEYKKTPIKAAVYFDLKAIRKFKQIFFQNHVNKKSSRFIVERTVDDAAQATFSNIGDTVLRFYLSDKKTGEIGTTFLELAPNTDKTIFLSTLGDLSMLHFFMVQNLDTINKGEFTLEFL